MTIKKLFAQDGAALDDRMNQLLEVLVQLLEEPCPPATDDTSANADLRSGPARAIHVSVD